MTGDHAPEHATEHTPDRTHTVTQLERWLLVGIAFAIFVNIMAIGSSQQARRAADKAEATAQRAIDATLANRQNGFKSRALSCEILDNMVQNPPLLELCTEAEVVALRAQTVRP